MAVMDTLREKAKEHNDDVGDVASKRTTAGTLKKCYDRGIGAYRTNPQSVRDNVSSAQQWAMSRVNSFLYALRNGKFRSGKHDTDLLPKGHPMSSKKSETKEPQLSYFRTVEEAEEYAEFLGCTGTHTHDMDGETYFMACSSHERNVELEEERMEQDAMDPNDDPKMSRYGIQYKSTDAVIKDLDRKTGVVTGYFSKFDNIDADQDIIVKGAFAKSIMENGPNSSKPRIMHLYQHDMRKPLGKPEVLREDDEGLYFESKIVGTSYGEDVLKLYEAGVINEHSIGFNTVKSEPKDGANYIYEVRLYEGSTVTFGANEDTPFTGFKSMTPKQAVERVEQLTKAVRNGTFTDDTFHLLEIQLKQLQQYIIDSLIDTPEPSKDTLEVDEPNKVLEAIDKAIINNLNFKV